MGRLEEMSHRRKTAHAKLLSLKSEVYAAFLEMATREEVLEAVEVGIEMGGGPATVSARFALDVMENACDA